MKLTNILALVFVVFLWGSSFTVLKIGVYELTPVTLAFLRFLIAIPFLIIITQGQHKNPFRKQFFKEWKKFSLLGLTGVTLYNILQNFGLQFTTASTASLIIASNPIFIAVLDHFYLKEKTALRLILGVFLAFLGIFLVIKPFEWSLHPMVLFGDLLCLGGALCWALYSVFSRKILSEYKASEITTYVMLFGTFFLLPFMLALEKFVLPTSLFIWLLLLFLGLFCSGLAYLLWGKALEEIPATKAGVFLYFIPVVSVSIAHFVLLEPIDIFFVVGTIFVMAGVAITEL